MTIALVHSLYTLPSGNGSGKIGKGNRDAQIFTMRNKRKSEPLKPRPTKKQKKKASVQEPELLPGENVFGHLNSDDEADDVILVDDDSEDSEPDHSEEEDVFIESDGGEEFKNQPNTNSDESSDENSDEEVLEEVSNKKENELTGNKDFIEFGFESSEEEGGEFSDDGVISNDEGRQINATNSSLYPWIKAHDHSTQKEISDWLTMEIKDFVNYISPSKEEIMMRNRVVHKLQTYINKCWPDAEAQVFGSYATDLYLPGSDIDMVVISENGDCEQRHKLYQLSSYLRQKNLAKDIEVITGAKVPIIKFIEPESNIQIDISFERTNGLDAAKRIRKWLSATAGLRELVMVIKQFLRSRRLNNVHVGGLGGYSTIILCYHFLKLHPRIATNTMRILDNLGSLLIEFFELYGRNFSYDNLILAIDPDTDKPKYLKKRQYSSLSATRNPFALVVQDPDDPNNNITRSSYNLRDIKKAFGGAYQLLTDRCYQLNSSSYKVRLGQSILGDIIKFKGKERDFNDDRDKVVNHALVKHEIEKEVKVVTTKEPEEYFSEVTLDTDDDVLVTEVKQTKKASEYISIESSDSEDDSKEVKLRLDKDAKREYWKQKGLEL